MGTKEKGIKWEKEFLKDKHEKIRKFNYES